MCLIGWWHYHIQHTPCSFFFSRIWGTWAYRRISIICCAWAWNAFQQLRENPPKGYRFLFFGFFYNIEEYPIVFCNRHIVSHESTEHVVFLLRPSQDLLNVSRQDEIFLENEWGSLNLISSWSIKSGRKTNWLALSRQNFSCKQGPGRRWRFCHNIFRWDSDKGINIKDKDLCIRLRLRSFLKWISWEVFWVAQWARGTSSAISTKSFSFSFQYFSLTFPVFGMSHSSDCFSLIYRVPTRNIMRLQFISLQYRLYHLAKK